MHTKCFVIALYVLVNQEYFNQPPTLFEDEDDEKGKVCIGIVGM